MIKIIPVLGDMDLQVAPQLKPMSPAQAAGCWDRLGIPLKQRSHLKMIN